MNAGVMKPGAIKASEADLQIVNDGESLAASRLPVCFAPLRGAAVSTEQGL
jgi:hypothetical protein